MRINKYVALATGMSRRAADEAITMNRVRINGELPTPGYQVADTDAVTLNDRPIVAEAVELQIIMLNKPVGYVCSREGQGSKTVYELLPENLHHLKPVGRLDKESSGLLLLTNDGNLANELTHPKYEKQKIYKVTLDKALQPLHRQMIQDHGIKLTDGVSKFVVERVDDKSDVAWKITMREGRNRQIRRTFEALGYTVTDLTRTSFGTHTLGNLNSGTYKEL